MGWQSSRNEPDDSDGAREPELELEPRTGLWPVLGPGTALPGPGSVAGGKAASRRAAAGDRTTAKRAAGLAARLHRLAVQPVTGKGDNERGGVRAVGFA